MVLVAYLIGTVASAQVPFTKAATKEVMKRVADWQIANPNNGAEHDDLDARSPLHGHDRLGRNS